MSSTNVLFIIFSLKSGGTQKMMLNIINNTDVGNRNKVLYLYNYVSIDSFENKINIPVIIYKYKSKNIFIKHLGRLLMLFRIISKEEIGKIVTFANQGALLASFSKIRYPRKRIIIILRQVSVFDKLFSIESRNMFKVLLNKLNYFLTLWFTYKITDKIICQTNAMAEDLIEKDVMLKNKITVINNYIDIKYIIKQSNEIIKGRKFEEYIVSIGRLSKEKDFLGVINAFAITKDKIIEDLVIIGEGVLKDELIKKCEELDVRDRVHFEGYQSNPYKYLKQAKLFVLNSEWEGLSNAIIEAMACKTPVISTNYPGIHELIENEVSGLIVEINNEIELSNAILRLSQSSDLREKLSKNGFLKAQEFKNNIHHFNRIIA